MGLPFNVDLTGKNIVVTGAGGVLCSCFSKALAECGANIALLDINCDMAKKIEEEITGAGYSAKAYTCDVLDIESIKQARDQLEKDFGTCDILINGAGGNHPSATTANSFFTPADLAGDTTSFFDLKPDGIEFVFRLNFIGTLLPTQVFSRDMESKKGSTIINISSMNAYRPLTKIPAYSAAKAAISNFTQWLAVHFSKAGIRVNAIAPGFFLTTQNEKLLMNEDGTPTQRTKDILGNTPFGRFGKEDELIGTLLYLVCEEASSFVTGIVIPVDGGFSAYSGV